MIAQVSFATKINLISLYYSTHVSLPSTTIIFFPLNLPYILSRPTFSSVCYILLFTNMQYPPSTILLKGTRSKRLVIRMSTKILDPEHYRTSAGRILSTLFPGWENDKRVVFRAVSVWPYAEYKDKAISNIVVDIKNHGYDLGTAHRDMTILPVYLLTPRTNRKGAYKVKRMRHRDKKLTFRLANLHEISGSTAQIPLLEDDDIRRKVLAKWLDRSHPQTQTPIFSISTLRAAGGVDSRMPVVDAIAMALARGPEKSRLSSYIKTLKIE